MLKVTVLPVPTFASAMVPVAFKVTTSVSKISLNVPPTVTVVVALYTLLVAVALVIVKGATVIFAVRPVGWVTV